MSFSCLLLITKVYSLFFVNVHSSEDRRVVLPRRNIYKREDISLFFIIPVYYKYYQLTILRIFDESHRIWCNIYVSLQSIKNDSNGNNKR